MYDSWGQPITSAPTYDVPNDTMPTGGTIRRAKKRNFKIGGAQALLIGLGGIAGLVLISSLLSGGNSHSLDEDDAVIASQPEIAETWQEPVGLHNLPADLSTLSTEDVERLLKESWASVERSHKNYLEALEVISTEVDRQRARDWRNYAHNECQKLNEGNSNRCINAADYLRSRLNDEIANLGRLAPTGQLALNSEAMKQYREQKQLITDLQNAIYMSNINSVSQTTVSLMPGLQARQGVIVEEARHGALALELQSRFTQGLGQTEGSHFDEP